MFSCFVHHASINLQSTKYHSPAADKHSIKHRRIFFPTKDSCFIDHLDVLASLDPDSATPPSSQVRSQQSLIESAVDGEMAALPLDASGNRINLIDWWYANKLIKS